jgi:predicted Ser/Thr protein kinase
MQTLQQLISGELKGTKVLKLSCGLTSFPQTIFELADTLEILDLSGNSLSELPSNFFELKKIKIVFFSENKFIEFPEVLSKCENLKMIGFKSNQIQTISETAFPKTLRWLILTNNQIEKLPNSIGDCKHLQKVALAGNKLTDLPSKMAQCENIELLRISANKIITLPDWLLTMPKLAWLAYSGNPCCESQTKKKSIQEINWSEFSINEKLGEGASGIIYKADWNSVNSSHKIVAIKLFKGDVTSDGYPEDEINTCLSIGYQKNLVKVIGKLKNHPAQSSGLVFELIPPNYFNLGNPPNFETCTRDTFTKKYTFYHILIILKNIANACYHLHSKGIMHGDLYAHNILIDEQGNTILGDFGAASIYDLKNNQTEKFELLDVRAYGYLIDDLLLNLTESDQFLKSVTRLKKVQNDCLKNENLNRPNFSEIINELNCITL